MHYSVFGTDRGFVVVAVMCVYFAIEILMLDSLSKPKCQLTAWIVILDTAQQSLYELTPRVYC